MLRGSEIIRLITMLGTLCILGAIVFRPHAPEVKQPPAEEEATKTAEKRAEKETIVPGPTDEDSEEMAAAQEAFQALTDGTLGIQPEEMFAYRRLFDWTMRQSFAAMKKRAEKNVPLDGLIRNPEKFRGKLMQVDLNVRQVLPYNEASLSGEDIYEIRGFNEKSGAWIYFVIAPSLPEGMPVGSNVDAQIRVEGYFLKLQGYLEAGAKPRAKPLKSPLLIGRIERFAPVGEKASPAGYDWLYLAASGFVLLSLIYTIASFFARRKSQKHQAQLEECKIQRNRAILGPDDSPEEDRSLLPDSRTASDEEGFDFMKHGE